MKERKAKLAGERPRVHPQRHVNQKKNHQSPKKPNEEQTVEDHNKMTSTPEKIKANGRVITLSEHTWAVEGPSITHRTKAQLMKKQSAKQRERIVAKSTETFDDNPLEFKEDGSPANR